MHNEAMKYVLNKVYNNYQGVDLVLSETAYFLHFNPQVESQFYNLDQNKKIEKLRSIAAEQDKNNEYFGLGRIAAGRSLGGRELRVQECPDIQFREELTDYFESISGGDRYFERTLNIKSALTEKGKLLDQKEIAERDISEYYEAAPTQERRCKRGMKR